MPIVSNTSPVLNLAIIGKLHLLKRQFDEVWVPTAVMGEFKLGSNLPGVAEIQTALDQSWLKVMPVRNTQLSQILGRDLDQGEAEAIGLALEVEAKMVLIDEHEGREIAKSVGLSPIGILGVLLREKNDGGLASISEAMNELREKAGFFITEDLYQRVIQAAQEK